MIQIADKKDYERLIEIWDSSVRAIHDFLSKDDFEYYKSQLPYYFKFVTLYVYIADNNVITGFLGVSEDTIEILFVENGSRGTGVGGKLLKFAIDCLKLTKVDVNEQNVNALAFYKHFGFKETGYSKTDSEGKNYPIINLKLLLISI